jgi:hypothetical protein
VDWFQASLTNDADSEHDNSATGYQKPVLMFSPVTALVGGRTGGAWGPSNRMRVFYQFSPLKYNLSHVLQLSPLTYVSAIVCPFGLQLVNNVGTRCNAIARRTMLQAVRSRLRDPIRSLNSSVYLNPLSRIRPWGFAQPLTEMSINILSEGRAQPVLKAGKFSSICEPIL